MNIDACRGPMIENAVVGTIRISSRKKTLDGDLRKGKALGMFAPDKINAANPIHPNGRWPANVLLDTKHVTDIDILPYFRKVNT